MAVSWCIPRTGFGSINSVSTWFGILVSILLRSSGPNAHAGPAACTWRRVCLNGLVTIGSITFRFPSEPPLWRLKPGRCLWKNTLPCRMPRAAPKVALAVVSATSCFLLSGAGDYGRAPRPRLRGLSKFTHHLPPKGGSEKGDPTNKSLRVVKSFKRIVVVFADPPFCQIPLSGGR